MNWYRSRGNPPRMESDVPGWCIVREDKFEDKNYTLWHNGKFVTECHDYQTLMERAEQIHTGWPK